MAKGDRHWDPQKGISSLSACACARTRTPGLRKKRARARVQQAKTISPYGKMWQLVELKFKREIEWEIAKKNMSAGARSLSRGIGIEMFFKSNTVSNISHPNNSPLPYHPIQHLSPIQLPLTLSPHPTSFTQTTPPHVPRIWHLLLIWETQTETK